MNIAKHVLRGRALERWGTSGDPADPRCLVPREVPSDAVGTGPDCLGADHSAGITPRREEVDHEG